MESAVSKQATLPLGGTRVENFIDVGDPGAPIGSPAWCKASHLQLCATKRQTDLDVRHLKFHLVDFKEKERWKHLTNNEHKPFRSWEDYLTYPEPNGLGISQESAEAIMKAVDGELIGQVLGPHGGDHGNQYTGGKRQGGIATLPPNEKNTVKHILGRLDRDGHTDMAAKVRAGEMSANAAAIKVKYRTPPTPFQTLKKLVEKLLPALSHDECEALRQMLE